MNRRYALPATAFLTFALAAAFVPFMKATVDAGLAGDARTALASGRVTGITVSSSWAGLTLTGPPSARTDALGAVRRMPHADAVRTVMYVSSGASVPANAGASSGTAPAGASGTGSTPGTSGPRARIEAITGGAGITFGFGTAALTPRDAAVLSQVAAVLAKDPNAKVTVTGYTDSSGTVAVNVPLSVARARSAEHYLAAHGVAANRMTTAGVGATRPVATNATAKGRAANRRVELTVQGD